MNNRYNLKKNITAVQIIRALVQLLSFIIAPGLFITVFSSIGELFQAVISGTFTFGEYWGKITFLAFVFITTFIFGRFFCGFVCSFGAMQDILWAVGKHFPKKISVSPKADKVLKYIKYVVLILIVTVIWGFGLFGEVIWSPWTIFGMYLTFRGFPSPEYMLSLGGLLMLLIIVGSLFIERFFCKYLCPLGALFSLVSRFRLLRINKPLEKCKGCTLCSKKCSMSLPLYEYETVRSGECINCMKCVEVCPKHNSSVHTVSAVSGAAAAAAVIGVAYIGTIAQPVSYTDDIQESRTENVSVYDTGKYQDDTYNGTGFGYRGSVSVSVTVSGGNITEININSYKDDEEFFEKAERNIIPQIISAQDTNVDTVSGATFSSKGIISAVEDALGNQILQNVTENYSGNESKENSIQESADFPEEETDNREVSDETSYDIGESSYDTSQKFADGVYTGSGTGFRGTTTVQVTVENGEITDIDVISYADDKQFFSKAQSGVISDIISSQSTDVDTVSGATFSSNGLIEAISDALGTDFTNPNSSVSGRKGRH